MKVVDLTRQSTRAPYLILRIVKNSFFSLTTDMNLINALFKRR